MKRFTFLGILLTFGCATALASVDVTNLYLEKKSQFTEFTIQCDQDFNYTHQIVEASGDKPYRIVVDIQDASHRLPQNDYENLPKSSITRIRTSQYSVEPEKIVRVVLDVQGVLTYKLKKHDNELSLLINTPDDKDFPIWSAVPGHNATYAAAPETPKEMPARPGNKPPAPVVDKNQPEKKGLQQTAKPAPKVVAEPNKEQPAPPVLIENNIQAFADVFVGDAAEAEQPATPVIAQKTETKPQAQPSPPIEQSTKPAVTEKPEPRPSSVPPAKRVDSAETKTMKSTPAGEVQQQNPLPKPPKTEKTALPETKATKRPVMAETKESEPASAESVAKRPSPASQQAAEDELQSATASQPTSESNPEAVHQRYIARAQAGGKDQLAPDDLSADAYESERPLDKVEKIRQKYRRGISFVRDDKDAARIEQRKQQKMQQQQGPVAYDEYVPQRQVVIYSSAGRRDPFSPLIEDADRAAEKSDLPDVRSLRLIGLLQDGETNRALFEDYNGFAYILQTGDRVKDGYLVSIDENHAVFQIRQYGWTRTVALELEEEN